MTPPASEPKKVAIISGASQGIGAGLVRHKPAAAVLTHESHESGDDPSPPR